MHRLTIGVALWLSAITSVAAEGTAFPQFDIAIECGRQAAATAIIRDAAGLPAHALQDRECTKREADAREAAKRLWRRIADEDRLYCATNFTNYYSLRSCAEQHAPVN